MNERELKKTLQLIEKNNIRSLTISDIKVLLKSTQAEASRAYEALISIDILEDISKARKPINQNVLTERLKNNDFEVHGSNVVASTGPFRTEERKPLVLESKKIDLRVQTQDTSLPVYINSKSFFADVEQYFNVAYEYDKDILIGALELLKIQKSMFKKSGYLDIRELENPGFRRIENIVVNRFIADFKFGIKDNKNDWIKYIDIVEEGYVAGPTAGGSIIKYMLPDGRVLQESNIIF